MPVVEFEDLSTLEAAWMGWFKVFSVMMFPDDLHERERSGANLLAWHISNAEKQHRAALDAAEAPSPTKEMHDPVAYAAHLEYVMDRLNVCVGELGGYGALVEARSISEYDQLLSKRFTDWFTAGLVLAFVRRMAAHHQDLRGGASVNKAVYIVEHSKLYPLVHRNSNYIRKAWSKYKSVSYYCATLYDFCLAELIKRPDPDAFHVLINQKLVVDFKEFISQSEAYLEFGLSFRPSRAKAETLLDPKQIWLLPKTRCWPRSTRTVLPLTGNLLEAAKEYRAPVPSA